MRRTPFKREDEESNVGLGPLDNPGGSRFSNVSLAAVSEASESFPDATGGASSVARLTTLLNRVLEYGPSDFSLSSLFSARSKTSGTNESSDSACQITTDQVNPGVRQLQWLSPPFLNMCEHGNDSWAVEVNIVVARRQPSIGAWIDFWKGAEENAKDPAIPTMYRVSRLYFGTEIALLKQMTSTKPGYIPDETIGLDAEKLKVRLRKQIGRKGEN
ncbi:hypothetical protein NliqN6_5991 [Naganishia liquefaciens]|uniref:Uncharacterized protein n=1 Tax=Naganishia liquefaciens TaxID=104408 RepID=A0A8H3YH86_9TREE|nr:hypothetical protein NliqN6_5991 [Naganishia liquefaciens]